MYVNCIQMSRIRCFQSAEISLLHPDRQPSDDITLPNINLLLGNNGAGKSTTLRAIALGVLARVLKEVGYSPYRMVRAAGSKATRSEPDHASIRSELVLGKNDRAPKGHSKDQSFPFLITIERHGDYEVLGPQKGAYLPDLFKDDTSAFFMVGYGATRRVADADYNRSAALRDRRERLQRVWGLFRDSVALMPLNTWLPQVSAVRRRKEIIKLLNDLLPPEVRFHGKLEHLSRKARSVSTAGDYLFRHQGLDVPFSSPVGRLLRYIAWTADLIYQLHRCTPPKQKLTDLDGLVLVDEIDLHLHPQWQLDVLETVSKALPRLQFVCTTHSPIVAGTLHREQVFVMESSENGSAIRKYQERLHGLNADQILTSAYFGLTSTRASEFELELEQLRDRAMDGDKSASIKLLRRLAGQTPEAAEEGLSRLEKPAAKSSRKGSRKRK